MVNDYHEAKHLSIEAFSELALNASVFKEKSSVKTYLFAIGKNLAKRYVKIRERDEHVSYEEVIETLIADDESPQSFLEREENKLLLYRVMEELKDEYRIVLQLLYFEDMSYSEAGNAMNKNVKQVANLAFRAKTTLKKKLESAGFID
ncbi:MAG: sigma-70 family RNA polymerase sigma factor [Oscillospiraceae bacterium]|nr:sigma-70 family RNA polymerase sigma factor [Oscillospiraceae bacterium]